MSNGNNEFTKVFSGTPNAFGFLQVGTLDVNTTNSTIINGEQYVTVTGFTSTNFASLAGTATAPGANVKAISYLYTSPQQVAASVVTDPRLLVIPANSVITSIVLSNNGGIGGAASTITPAAQTYVLGTLPKSVASPFSTPPAPLIGVAANNITGQLLMLDAPVANINNGCVAQFNSLATVPPGSATSTGVPLIMGATGITLNAGFVTVDTLVGVYNTTAGATANTTGALKAQITYITYTK